MARHPKSSAHVGTLDLPALFQTDDHALRWRGVQILDWLLVFGPRHLDRVLWTYVEHYNQKRPHRGLHLLAPESTAPVATPGVVPHVQRRDLLGGLIHEYESAA